MNNLCVLDDKDVNRFNCVKWVRARVTNLPFGLWTIYDKKKIIDTKNAKKGRVAIMDYCFPIGHLGIVKDVSGNFITILEANFLMGKITERIGKMKELKILGFFNPEKKKWNKKN